MKSIEKKLTEEREKIDNITAPPELAEKLSGALDNIPAKRKRNNSFFMKIAVAAIIFIVFTGYNYNALAYYSKKILGFDDIIHDTLKALNEADMGQVIDESLKLEDGTTFTIDGIMSDENQFVLFYTITNPNGVESIDLPFLTISGFMTTSSRNHGSGIYSDDGTEYKAIDHFEPIKPF